MHGYICEAVVHRDSVGRGLGARLLREAVTELWRLGGAEFWLRSVAGHPGEVYGGKDWSFWQYTSTGVVPGIAGKVDINVFAGSKANWVRWLGARAL